MKRLKTWWALLWFSTQDRNKLIERTCKYDAYEACFFWGRGVDMNEKGNTLWYAKEKKEGHREFLREHKFRYVYSSGFILNDGYYNELG